VVSFLRMKRHLRQFAKYAVAGALATAVDVLVFYTVAIWA